MSSEYALAVGPFNDEQIREEADAADLVVAVWGQPNGVDRVSYDRRIAEVMEIVGVDRLTYVGRRANGYPLHWQCWSNTLPLLEWL